MLIHPIHLITVYGLAGAMDDAEKLRRNEEFLTKIFETANAYGDVPVCVVGDLNTEPQRSAMVSTQLVTGNWVDIAHAKAELNGQVAENTYNGPRGSSRIDLCLLNWAAAELFIDYRPCYGSLVHHTESQTTFAYDENIFNKTKSPSST